MSVTPNDIEMPDGPVVCFCCDNTLTANHRAITFHAARSGKSLILCGDCVPSVVGSLVQDWARLDDEIMYQMYPDRRDRIFDAFKTLEGRIL